MKWQFIRVIVFIFGIFLVVSLSRSIWDLWQKGSLLGKEEERFAKIRLENEELNKEFTRLKSLENIEKQARDKLGLSKEGEVVVILPPVNEGSSKTEEIIPKKETAKAVWEQWLSFLFN